MNTEKTVEQLKRILMGRTLVLLSDIKIDRCHFVAAHEYDGKIALVVMNEEDGSHFTFEFKPDELTVLPHMRQLVAFSNGTTHTITILTTIYDQLCAFEAAQKEYE